MARDGALAAPLRQLFQRAAHDLRGHLNCISLNTSLLARAQRGELHQLPDADRKREEWIGAVEDEVRHMTSLLEVWGSLQAEETGEPESVDLRIVLGELDALLASWVQAKQLRLEIERPTAEVPLRVHRTRLLRVLCAGVCHLLAHLSSGDGILLRLSREEDRARLDLQLDLEEEGRQPPWRDRDPRLEVIQEELGALQAAVDFDSDSRARLEWELEPGSGNDADDDSGDPGDSEGKDG